MPLKRGHGGGKNTNKNASKELCNLKYEADRAESHRKLCRRKY